MFVMVRHKVRDYEAWRPHFDAHADERKAAGCVGAHLFRSADDPNELVITFTWDDSRIDDARAMVESEDVRKLMSEAGVIDEPDVYFLSDLGRTPS